VNAPDRAAERLSEEEREAAAQTFYIRSPTAVQIFLANLATLFKPSAALFAGYQNRCGDEWRVRLPVFRRSKSY